MKLLFILLGNVCISAMIAYLMGRSATVRRLMVRPVTLKSGLFFTAVFSCLAIVSSYYGVRILGALASTRVVGVLMAGILGGPWTGLATGIIGGLHRWHLGGFTAPSCAVATALAGLMAGLVRSRMGFARMDWMAAAAIALAAEILQKSLTLIFAKPFEAALAFERVAALPTTIITVVGTVLFMLILKDVQKQADLAGAAAAQVAMRIANETMPFLRHGLTPESAQKTAEVIVKHSGVAAACITDTKTVLAYAGMPVKNHRVNVPIRFPDTFQALRTGKMSSYQGDHGCGNPDCPLYYGVSMPLVVDGRSIGIIRFYQTAKRGISSIDVEMVEGIGRLLSTQIKLADYAEQQALREEAEFKALQSQINPHFLFNTLSIIISFCRTDPEKARELLGNLSQMLHFSFAPHDDLIPLEDEYANVENYLDIVKSRFGDRLIVEENIDDEALSCLLPAFTLQPLIENALTHGLFPKTSDCRLAIGASPTEDGRNIVIHIADNGVGMDEEKVRSLTSLKSRGIGVANVLKRLKGTFKDDFTFDIKSRPGEGTVFTLTFPARRKAMSA